MNKNIFQQMYKHTHKVIFKELRKTKKMIDFIEKSKFKCNDNGEPEFDGLDKESLKELFGLMWKNRLVDEKQKFINLGSNYINQSPIFQNKKQERKFLINKNEIFKQINLLSNKPCLITRRNFKPENLNLNKTFSLNCKNEINSFQNPPSTSNTKPNSPQM
ncbi:hypothetical protein [Spiroplasma endosymbiont of Nebria brevicollis]|uniref:hypothetical protein n=1 Tax=Spiroplasma endosymbiont of Nebria brevicollis TaxID=3066284 RepID=UPI00313DCBD9